MSIGSWIYLWAFYSVPLIYISLIIREMQIKPQWGTITRHSGWLLSESLQAINAGEGVEKGNPLTLLVEMQTSTAAMENSVEISLKTGNRTAIWPSNPTSGHTQWGNKIWKRHVLPNVHRSTVITARTWKQPRCPAADKWIRKLWYIYTMEYYSAIKKNSFESVLMRWMKLEPII